MKHEAPPKDENVINPNASKAEILIERTLIASRWLMAPFYLGLVIALMVVLFKFFEALLHYVMDVFVLTEEGTVTGALALVDLALLGSLILIVIFSGYENFVSQIETGKNVHWPAWMTKVDFSGLKLKLLASIVLISAIQVLKGFMKVGTLSDRDLWWMVGIHMVFMVSGVLLAWSDYLQSKSGHKD